MVFSFSSKLPNFKVIAVRLRKNRQNHNSAIPVVLPSPVLPSDKDQLASIINRLSTILQTIDRHAQNTAAIASVRRRLQRLWGYLCNAPSAHDGSEQSRRDELISLLQGISDQLTKSDNGGLGYQSVAQALAGFSTELDHYLAEYTRATQMHTQNDVLEIKTEVLQFLGSAGMGLPRTVTRHCLTLVDAIGREHEIPMEFCISRQKFNETLQALFANNSFEADIQRKYIEQGQYDLCINQETQLIELTDKTDGWSRIEAGTKVVMRVIIHREVQPYSIISCVACGDIDVSVRSSGIKRSDRWTICCQGCDRRYQISNPSLSPKNASVTRQATDHAIMDLIRNVHVQENFLEERLLRLEGFGLREFQLREDQERLFRFDLDLLRRDFFRREEDFDMREFRGRRALLRRLRFLQEEVLREHLEGCDLI